MADQKILDRWAEKLLDTGKRNNLISFKDTKASTAEIIFPSTNIVFSRCVEGKPFEVYDPKIVEPDEDDDFEAIEDSTDYSKIKEKEAGAILTSTEHVISSDSGKQPFESQNATINSDQNANSIHNESDEKKKKLTKEEYYDTYFPLIKNDRRFVLAYAQTPNPITAVKNIAKRAKEILDETGNNATYLAFGFLRWKGRDDSNLFFRAPLLLIKVVMVTGSIIEPVKIIIDDDDVIVNPTFNYMLQTDYGITLPEYKDEEPLHEYFGRVSDLVKRLGWDVIDECKLSVFSFLKLNMYEDIKQNGDLILKSPNILSLLGERISGSGSSSDIEHVVNNPLIDLHTVIDADNSQIEAVEMAKSGKSFVLQGPPGTGKSQTITNIIAECLYDGKKVLFVSEKQAALNVVFDKLKKVGLSDFCLELHSHKANKKGIIAELNRTLEAPKGYVSSAADEEIRQKGEAQKRLDDYATALHKKREPIKKSLFELYEAYSAERHYPDLHFSIKNIQYKGNDYLQNAVGLLERYAEYTESIGQDYHENAWYGFCSPRISFEERNQLKDDLHQLIEGYQKLLQSVSVINEQYGEIGLNYEQASGWRSALNFLGSSDVITPALISDSAREYAVPYYAQLKELSEQIAPIKSSVLEFFKPEAIREINGDEINIKLIERFYGTFSRMLSREYKTLIASIRPLWNAKRELKYQQLVTATDDLARLQALLDDFDRVEEPVKGAIGPYYLGEDTDWTGVFTAFQQMGSFYKRGYGTSEVLSNMNFEEYERRKKTFKADSNILAEELKQVAEAKDRLQRYFNLQVVDLEHDDFESCIKKLKRCEREFDSLSNWIDFIELHDQLNKKELLPFVDLTTTERIPAENITGIYRKAFYRHWIESILFSTPELRSFSRIKQDQAVRNFKEKDDLQYQINRSLIKARLSQRRPNLDMVAGGSAVSILRHEGEKRRKLMPIRKLLVQTGSVVQQIKPCFLMSPLSVSTFLDPNAISFDTIIFDEASQIFPQDAIGAIYRGNQLIVVGDSKQMPPSNYFNAYAETDDDEDDENYLNIADYESILDICKASDGFKAKRLLWHYRSHYEQLIAFSNVNFYNGSLITFPSSITDREGIGVDYYYVNGVFDRQSKTNRAEAEFIVNLIYKNIREYPNRSLGVVAFSIAQQDLIDRLLSKKRESDSSYEWFFKADNKEPFFIKNLETVQGDERDTIIFSVAYAKDGLGRFYHNFGPLNRQGGERRLNVAVTRAKDNVQLVTSIHYTDINLNNSKSEGVRLLRAYLDYAQNGEDALERIINVAPEDQFDSDFEQEVCDYLRDQGYTVDTQVGCSGYRIDLGLRKPDSSDYLLAIECDGATYHRSKNARDRDALRQSVLENMGWQFYRIWSTDWFRNKQVEKERLLNRVKQAVIKGKETQATVSENKSNVHSSQPETEVDRFLLEEDKPTFSFPQYRELNAINVLAKDLYNLPKTIREILEIEAPLSEEYLMKRIVKMFGREKVTSYVVDRFNNRMFGYERYGIIRKNGFLYLQGKSNYTLRIPGDKREIKYIALEELADGMYTIIKHNVAVSKEGLFRTLINELGFTRMGDAITTRLEEALSQLLCTGLILEENGQLSLK